jgi:hypothetical protein
VGPDGAFVPADVGFPVEQDTRHMAVISSRSIIQRPHKSCYSFARTCWLWRVCRRKCGRNGGAGGRRCRRRAALANHRGPIDTANIHHPTALIVQTCGIVVIVHGVSALCSIKYITQIICFVITEFLLTGARRIREIAAHCSVLEAPTGWISYGHRKILRHRFTR